MMIFKCFRSQSSILSIGLAVNESKFSDEPVVVIYRLSIKKVVKCYSRIVKLDLPMLTNGGSLNPRNFIPQVDRLSCKDSKDCYEFLPFEIVKL